MPYAQLQRQRFVKRSLRSDIVSRQKTVLITGCSSGIGRALALEFAQRGFNVIATVRNAESIEELPTRHKNITPLFVNVQKPKSITALKDEVKKLTNGRIDFLVNNAGVHYASTALDLKPERVREVFEVNLIAVMQMCQAFADFLMAAKGVIVQIGSVTRAVPMIWQGPYNASKAALSQYTKTMRLELEPFGVRVVEVVTGYVQSKILRNGLRAPSTSLYLPIRGHIENLKNQGNRNGMHADEYARFVVERVTRPNPSREIWAGARAQTLWFIVTWLPLWIQVFIWNRTFGLNRLRSGNLKRKNVI
ncbi:NADPH-dependent 1-acyldihydroxyacetone phosphate reductase [Cercospora beticola]|uniref:NADPH-dependent 1-acyldihydroxyacetone phosphate reductase n=1 Tax=Cercospora beticola TaxID=122368 RepID=A0A2G5HPH4_CERBT|nr:NADPH-dependent 1-acyldihydroxyacetone phosphate reductase [Cercospora beticola]PIA94430.1 NADPH-dependent 1-acyldihydroxyacetone phosphate reductase [Cercospora beticola]WPB05549.1 hypothetical protein RHO25_010202 [Cercospora beticola]